MYRHNKFRRECEVNAENRADPVERQIPRKNHFRATNGSRTQRCARRDAYLLTGFSRTNEYICPFLFLHMLVYVNPWTRFTIIPADAYHSGVKDPILRFIAPVTLYDIWDRWTEWRCCVLIMTRKEDDKCNNVSCNCYLRNFICRYPCYTLSEIQISTTLMFPKRCKEWNFYEIPMFLRLKFMRHCVMSSKDVFYSNLYNSLSFNIHVIFTDNIQISIYPECKDSSPKRFRFTCCCGINIAEIILCITLRNYLHKKICYRFRRTYNWEKFILF